MASNFPFNMVALSVANTMLVGIAFILGIKQSLLRTPMAPRSRRRVLYLVTLMLAVLYFARFIVGALYPGLDAILVVVSIVGFYVAVGTSMSFSQRFRQIIRDISQDWLIGIQTLRIGGFVFLGLLDLKLLPSEFAIPAGYGDVVVGFLAPLALRIYRKDRTRSWVALIAWNIFGMLDLVVAMITGIVFIAPFARTMVLGGQSINYLNYVLLVPGFAVPILFFVHIRSLANLKSEMSTGEA